MHQKSLNIRLKVFGPDHLDTAKAHESIAIVHAQQGKHAEAVESFKEVLAITETVLGHKHRMWLILTTSAHMPIHARHVG